MSELLHRWRAWRLDRAELRLADRRHHYRKWGFANTPSEDRREERLIARAEHKVDRLSARLQAGERER